MRSDDDCLSSQWKMAPSKVFWNWLMEDLVMWQVTCFECSVHSFWHRSEMSDCGMEGRPLRLVQHCRPIRSWL